MVKIYVDGLPRMVLTAISEIKKGAELTYDYKFDNFEAMIPQKCFCGSENCRGTLAKKKTNGMGLKRVESLRKMSKKRPFVNSPSFLRRNLQAVPEIIPELPEETVKANFMFKRRKPIETANLSEKSKLLWKLLNRFESTFKESLARVAIPQQTAIKQSRHDRITYLVTMKSLRHAITQHEYDVDPTHFQHAIYLMLDNIVKYFGVNCEEFNIMKQLKCGYNAIKKEAEEQLR